MDDKPKLKRNLSLTMMVLYGLGTTIGAGIYALVGELANTSGYLAPAAFLIASIMASLTAMSFAELSGRYPKAAGEALYVLKGFSSVRLSTLTGVIVALAGIVSSAALLNAFVGYLSEFIEVNRYIAIIIIVSLVCIISIWGIAESVTVASIITLMEIGGLILVIFVSRSVFFELPDRWVEFIPSFDMTSASLLFSGALLSFYAFIGFEDMVNVAEEVKNVRRNLPLSILITLGVTTVLYVLVMLAAVLAIPIDELSLHQAPLSLIYEQFTGGNAVIISFIGLFAILNGALIQVIMASRILYGLSSRDQLPGILSVVHAKLHTPVYATILASLIVLVLALLGRLATLAEATSVIMLTVFAFVNLALVRIKLKEPYVEGILLFPIWIPIIAFIVSTGFVVMKFQTFITG